MNKYNIELTEDQLKHLKILLEYSISETMEQDGEPNPFEIRLRKVLAKAKYPKTLPVKEWEWEWDENGNVRYLTSTS